MSTNGTTVDGFESAVATVAFVDLAGFSAITDVYGDASAIAVLRRFDADALPLGERTGIPRLISEIITTRASIRLPEVDTQGARSDQEKALELFRNAGADRSALNGRRPLGCARQPSCIATSSA